MPIRVKVDEDLSRDAAERLRAAGFDALTVLEEGLTGSPDAELWTRTQSEDRWLLTADKGFADIRQHPPGTHKGVILLRLEHESRVGYLRLVDRLLTFADLDVLSGSVIVVTPSGIRVHRA